MVLPGQSPRPIHQPVLRFLRTSASSGTSLPRLWAGQIWASLSQQAQSCQVQREVCSLTMELPGADLDLLNGCLYGIVGGKQKNLHVFVLLLELYWCSRYRQTCSKRVLPSRRHQPHPWPHCSEGRGPSQTTETSVGLLHGVRWIAWRVLRISLAHVCTLRWRLKVLQQVPLRSLWLKCIYLLLLHSAAGRRPQLEFSSILGVRWPSCIHAGW